MGEVGEGRDNDATGEVGEEGCDAQAVAGDATAGSPASKLRPPDVRDPLVPAAARNYGLSRSLVHGGL